MLERKKTLVDRVVHIVLAWLKEDRTFTSPLVQCKKDNSGEGRMFISVSHISSVSLLVQEGYVLAEGETRMYRSWSFFKEGNWDVVSLEKNGKPVVVRNLYRELDELLAQLEVLSQVISPVGYSVDEELADLGMEFAVPKELRPETKAAKAYRQFVSWAGWRSPVFYAVVALLFCLIFGLSLLVVQLYGIQLTQEFLVNTGMEKLEARIAEKEKALEARQGAFDSQSAEMKEVVARLERNEEIFLQNFYAMVLQMERELPPYYPLRKRAYRLIAKNIHESATNGEILYEMNRLPQTEYLASVFLETNSDSVVNLSGYKPIISSILYPVQISHRDNDGKGFRITSGYMAKRSDPLGTQRSHTHHAVDIMNVSNIRRINSDGSLDREGMPNGDVIAVDNGVVTVSATNPIFGNILEIRHPMNPEVRERFPGSVGWRTFYAHLDAPSPYRVGDEVTAGAKIAEIGNTGSSTTGAHLHFEIRIDFKDKNGVLTHERVNPYPGSEEVDSF